MSVDISKTIHPQTNASSLSIKLVPPPTTCIFDRSTQIPKAKTHNCLTFFLSKPLPTAQRSPSKQFFIKTADTMETNGRLEKTETKQRVWRRNIWRANMRRANC